MNMNTNEIIPQKKMPIIEKIIAALSIGLISLVIGGMALACFAIMYEAWFRDPSAAAREELRWDMLDNEWDRNMHDPSQRPPDSIANEARLKMLLLEPTPEEK